MELNNVIKENVDKRGIKVPKCVKEISDEEVIKFAKSLLDGKTNVYAVTKDNNKVVTNQVFLKDQIIMQLICLEDVIEQKEELIKNAKGSEKKELKKELMDLYKQKQLILVAPTYSSLICLEENEPINEEVKTDLALTLEDISTYCINRK